nr:hypothetical protein [uncultured Brevundimonas sp.]
MPRYFLHLRRGEEAFLDAEGSEFSDLEALRRAALHDARDTMSWDIKEGRLDLSFRIEAVDQSGRTVLSLGFDEAVTITQPERLRRGG